MNYVCWSAELDICWFWLVVCLSLSLAANSSNLACFACANNIAVVAFVCVVLLRKPIHHLISSAAPRRRNARHEHEARRVRESDAGIVVLCCVGNVFFSGVVNIKKLSFWSEFKLNIAPWRDHNSHTQYRKLSLHYFTSRQFLSFRRSRIRMQHKISCGCNGKWTPACKKRILYTLCCHTTLR